MPRAHQHIRRRHQPVADMEAEDATARPLDLAIYIWVPPNMIHVDHYTDLVGPDFVCHIVGETQRRDLPIGPPLHGMQGLNPDSDAARLGMRGHRREPSTTIWAPPSRSRLPLEYRRKTITSVPAPSAAAFVESAKVIIDATLPFFRGQGREHAPAA